MRMIVQGDFSEQDFIKFAIFLKNLWKHRQDTVYIYITHGMEDVPSEKVMEVFKKIFEKDKIWSIGKITPEVAKEFFKSVLED